MAGRRATEAPDKLEALERALRTLTACSRLLVSASEEKELLDGFCRLFVGEPGYRLAWIGFAAADEYGSVAPVAQAGFEEGYLETLRVSWRDNERGRGPTGTAIRTGRRAVARNIAEDVEFSPWRQEALQRGYASSIALPLKLRDGTVGALNIYSDRPDAFDTSEEELLAEIAENLALGISALRGEAARAQAEDRLRQVVDNMPVLMDAFDADGNIVAWNRAAEELTGYKAEEIVGNDKALELLYPDPEYRTQMLEEWQRRGDDYIGWQWDLTAKDGSRRTVEWSNISARSPIPGWRTWGVGVDVTDRVETERRYRDLFENVPIGLWVEDASAVKKIIDEIDLGETSGWRQYFSEHPEVVARCAAAVKVIDVNRAAVALHKARSKEELIGSLDRIFAEDSMSTFVEELSCLAEGKTEVEAEGPALTLEGDPNWVALRLRVAPGEEDRWSRVLVSTVDVTARRAAEEELAQQLSLLETLAEFEKRVQAQATRRVVPETLEFLSEVVGIPHSSIALIEPSGSALRLAFLEKGFGNLRQGELLPISDTVLHEVIQDREPRYRPDLQVEATDYRVDRELIASGYISDYLVPLMHEGSCIGTLNCASPQANGIPDDKRRLLDLIAPRLAQHIANAGLFDELETSERKFRSLVSNLPGAVYRRSADPSWAAQYISDEIGRLTGYSPAEFNGEAKLSYADIIHAEDLGRVRQALSESVERREPYVIEYRIVTADGEEKWVWEKGRAEYDEDGKPLWLDGVIVDVTERRRLEEEVLSSHKMESLGILASGIAHDFNNLLMSVLGGADLALQYLPPSSPARQPLEDVATAAYRAGDLANQLLAYSGKGSSVVEPVDLSALVEETSHLVEAAVSKKIRIAYDLDRELPAVEADLTQIRQIALNLVTNAAEAIGHEVGLVSIATGSRDCSQEYLANAFSAGHLEAGPYVYLQVRDTGKGMDLETRKRIFDPFFSTKPTGRGLGLAATLGIVRGHRGAIQVESQPGRGTAFTLLFPASDRVALERAEPPTEPEWTASGTVLLVDDEESVRSVAGTMLKNLGFSVLTAAEGREGVEMFRQRADDIALVLLDLAMPEMGGDEALGEIIRIRSDAKVLLSSGYHEQDPSNRSAAQRVAGFIQKPYRIATLRRKVREILES